MGVVWRLAAAALAVAVCLPALASAKLVEGTLVLSSEATEQYLSKFSFSVGKGFIEGNFSCQGQYFDHFRHDLRIFLYSDVGFAKYKQMLKKGTLCRERMAEASWSTKIAPERKRDSQFFSFTTEVNVVGRTHYWYAVAADCWLEEYNAHPPKFDYKLTFLNSDKSHIPADESGLFTLHLVLLLCMVAFGAYCARALLVQFRKQGHVHLATVLFVAAFVCQLVSVVCETAHLWRYAADGRGLRWGSGTLPCDQASSVLQTLSEAAISVLLLCVASGWTLSASMGVEAGTPGAVAGGTPVQRAARALLSALKSPYRMASRQGPASLFIPALGVLMVWLEFLGHKYDDDFNQFHDFEHTPGYLAILLRASMCGVFVLGINSILPSTPHVVLVQFLKRLRVAGCVWFLGFPLLVVATVLFPPYMRHQVVSIVSLLVQTAALGVIGVEMMAKGEYYKLSSLSNSGSLGAVGPAKTSKLAMD